NRGPPEALPCEGRETSRRQTDRRARRGRSAAADGRERLAADRPPAPSTGFLDPSEPKVRLPVAGRDHVADGGRVGTMRKAHRKPHQRAGETIDGYVLRIHRIQKEQPTLWSAHGANTCTRWRGRTLIRAAL